MIKRVLFYGDSNTWGYRPGGGRLPANRRYTTMVTRQALNVYPLVDGLNGRCSAWRSGVFPQELLGGASLAASVEASLPLDGLVIMLGTNDVMPPLNLRAEEICDNQRRMIRRAREIAGTDLFVCLISPPPLSEQGVTDIVGFDQGDRDILTQDLATPMARLALEERAEFLDAACLIPHMDAEDGFHLEEVGHLRLGIALGQLLRTTLCRRGPSGR